MNEKERKSILKKLTFYCQGDNCTFFKRGRTTNDIQMYICKTCNKSFIPREKPIDFSAWADIDKKLDKETHQYFRWKRNFDKLRAFYEKHGHAWPTQQGKTKERRTFGMWVSWQRTLIRKGHIHPLKIELLESVGISLDYYDYYNKDLLALRRKRNKHQLSFPKQLQLILKWKEKHGRWPTQFKGISKKETYLGRVVSTWRARGKLYEDQMDILDSHGFVWNTKDERFLENIERIKAFKQKFGGYFLNGQERTQYDLRTVRVMVDLRRRLPRKDWKKKIVKELKLGVAEFKRPKK